MALSLCAAEAPRLILLDLRLGSSRGLDLLPELRRLRPDTPVIVITAYASFESVVEAMNRGANDYLPKPFTPDQLGLAVHKALKLADLESRVALTHQTLPLAVTATQSPEMAKLFETINRLAAVETPVLFLGESGVGKTLFARHLHESGPRKSRPFVTLSCPSIPSELLESELFGHVKGSFTGALKDQGGKVDHAQGGTLFLDEIGDLPLPLQPKLLRFLQDLIYERVGDPTPLRADVRVIAATNHDLEKRVAQGLFRQDLFFRLAVFPLTIPPLRARPQDISSLAQHLLEEISRAHHREAKRLDPEALSALTQYPWPGNIRELRNVLERAALLSDEPVLVTGDFPEIIGDGLSRPSSPAPGSLAYLEAEQIKKVLANTPSLEQAAQTLGIHPATLWRKRQRYGL